MSKKIKEVQVDNHSFNADHYEGVSLVEFIKAELAGVPDSYGAEEQKKEFLKQAWAKLNPDVKEEKEKPNGKEDKPKGIK